MDHAWTGRWIWWTRPPPAAMDGLPPEGLTQDVVVCFRRRVRLPVTSAPVRVRVTADGRYRLRVNGVEVMRGPVRSEPGTLFYDLVELPAPTGDQVTVEALVRFYGRSVPWWRPSAASGELGRGGFLMDCETVPELSTGPGWDVAVTPRSFGPHILFGPPNEHVDNLGSVQWRPAVVLAGEPPCAPHLQMLPSPVRVGVAAAHPLAPRARGAAVGELAASQFAGFPSDPLYAPSGRHAMAPCGADGPVALSADEGLLFDAEGIVIGVPVVEVSADAGTVVTLRAAERLQDGDVCDPERQWVHTHRCTGEPRETVQPFESVGLRYLQVSGSHDLTVYAGRVDEHRALVGAEGDFSADAELTAIWRLGRRTLEVCTTDSFLDCPTREQRAWLSDGYLHTLLTLVTSGDVGVCAAALRLHAQTRRAHGLLSMVAAGDFAASGTTIPDSSLHFVRAVARIWDHTADAELADELLEPWPAIDRWFAQHVEGDVLGPLPGWVFLDWIPLDTSVPSASVQALYVLALRDAADVAEAVDQPRHAERWRSRADTLAGGLTRFRRSDGLYRETLEPGPVTQHAVSLAVLCGCVAADEGADLLARAIASDAARDPVRAPGGRGWRLADGFDPDRHVLAVQPFSAHWLHQALAATRSHELLVCSIRRWAGYLGTGDGTVWEHWPEEGESWSHAHAWAATPTYDLPSHIAGIQPGSPGWATVTVAPALDVVPTVQARMPTPRGVVSVDAAQGRAAVHLPLGVAGRFSTGTSVLDLQPGDNQLSW